MNRDEALRHQQFNQPCFYKGDASLLQNWQGKPLYIWKLNEGTALVSTTPPPISVSNRDPKTTVLMKLSELTAQE